MPKIGFSAEIYRTPAGCPASKVSLARLKAKGVLVAFSLERIVDRVK